MKTFRALPYLAGVCVVLLLSVLQADFATTAKAATSSVPVSVLNCPQGPPASGVVPQFGGTLKILFNNNVTNIGMPWGPTQSVDAQAWRFAVESLIGLDPNARPIPQLATGWTADPAKKTITFTLRQGVKFHDGTDFNAAAVKWNFDTYRNSARPDLKTVTAVDVIDNTHVRMTFSEWDPIFLQNALASNCGKMVSPTSAQKLGDAARFHPVGTGPFKFVSFQPNVSLKYARWEGYWQKGLPYLDAVEIDFVSDQVVALTSFTRGESHAIYGLSAGNAKNLKAAGNVIDSYTGSIQSLCGDSKNKNSPFADIRVRQAIAYAIDNKTIVRSVFDGMIPSTNQMANEGFQAFNPAIKGYPYNPAKARELLTAAGYSKAKPLTQKLVFQANSPNRDFWTAIQGALQEVDINVTLEPIDNAAFAQLNGKGWNNSLLEMGWSYNGLQMQYSQGLTRGLSEAQYTYVSVWTPDDFNKLYRQMLLEGDLDKRDEHYKTLNKMAVDDYCLVVPLFVSQQFSAKSPKVGDFGLGRKTTSEFLPERAWLKK